MLIFIKDFILDYIYIYIHVYIYIYVYIYICIYTYINIYVYTYLFIKFICVSLYIYIYICTHIYHPDSWIIFFLRRMSCILQGFASWRLGGVPALKEIYIRIVGRKNSYSVSNLRSFENATLHRLGPIGLPKFQ